MCREDIINKIAKLLAKTEQSGCTPEEAATSIAMAHKLMAKYGVEINDLKAEDEVITQDLSMGTKSVSSLQASLAVDIANHFGCAVYLHNTSSGQTIRVVGEKEKVAVYKTTYMFAYNAFKKSWERYMRTLDCSTSEKNSLRGTYFKGFVDGITNELVKQENEFGLVVVKSSKVDEYMANLRFGKARQVSVRQVRDAETYSKGYQEGATSHRMKNSQIDTE